MNKDEEIHQQLDDIRYTLKKQDSVLFSIGLMVVGMGSMVALVALYLITKVL